MAQRSIEILIGRLITDEGFRSAFRRNTTDTLTGFTESGYDLTPLEIDAMRTTSASVWDAAAARVDARLQKISFTRTEEES